MSALLRAYFDWRKGMWNQDVFLENLKSARISKNYTQKDMAERLGTTQGAYQKWESGGREPNFENLIKLAEVFNVSVDKLLGVKIENN